LKATITTIGATLIAGVILLNVEYSFFTDEKSNVDIAKSLVKKISKSSVKHEPEFFVEDNIGVLETMLKAASSINVYQQRNKEYQRLVELALKDSKPGFAFNVASEINIYQTRNREYVKIIAYALKNEKLSLAYAIVEKINVYQVRNEEYKKIIVKGLELKEKTSNKSQHPNQNPHASFDR